MRINLALIIALLGGLLLQGCGGQIYERAYTASGEGISESDLRPDAQFSTQDDLNVVVKLNPHDETVAVLARFTDPNGDLLQEVSGDADNQTGTLVLGIDYAARNDQTNEWLRGRYRVDILLDEETVETLYFRVD